MATILCNPIRTAVTPAERQQRYGHYPAVVFSRSSALLFALQRALFERGAAVAVLQVLPEPAILGDLLANGLIILVPPPFPDGLDDTTCLYAVSARTLEDSVRFTIAELERRGTLAPVGLHVN